jgi:NADH-quinone oxidoreductase subunit N
MELISNIFSSILIYWMKCFIPEIALIIMLVLAIIIDVIFKKHPLVTGYFSVFGFIIIGILICCYSISSVAFSGLLSADPFSQFFKVIIVLGSLIATLMTFNSKEIRDGANSMGEYYIMLIGMTIGMFLLSSANNLLMIYLAFETMSICSYILAGYTKEVKRASEASLKYVIYGSLASGLMIYGISLLFGLTGTFDLREINIAIQNFSGNELALITSGLLIFSGIAYKISAVPFHFWTPDVYEGSPVATTALLSVISKAAGFAVLIRFLKAGFIDGTSISNDIWNTVSSFDWHYLIAIVSVITMTLGNLIAIWQDNVKRMLAYSSIAHCGYMLMGVMVMDTAGIEGVLFYFITYLLMNFGAFLVVQLTANKIGSEDMNDYAGLAYKNPFIAAAMTIFLLSLMGMPPFAGFISKFYLFTPVIEAGYIGIAVIGVLNSVVSVFYYAKVIRNMYIRGYIETKERISFGKLNMIFLYCLVVPVVLMIINFKPLLEWVKNSTEIVLK